MFVEDTQELCHSKKNGDGYVDSEEKIMKILDAVGRAIKSKWGPPLRQARGFVWGNGASRPAFMTRATAKTESVGVAIRTRAPTRTRDGGGVGRAGWLSLFSLLAERDRGEGNRAAGGRD